MSGSCSIRESFDPSEDVRENELLLTCGTNTNAMDVLDSSHGIKGVRVVQTFGADQLEPNDLESAKRAVRRLVDPPPDKFPREYFPNLGSNDS